VLGRRMRDLEDFAHVGPLGRVRRDLERTDIAAMIGRDVEMQPALFFRWPVEIVEGRAHGTVDDRTVDTVIGEIEKADLLAGARQLSPDTGTRDGIAPEIG